MKTKKPTLKEEFLSSFFVTNNYDSGIPTMKKHPAEDIWKFFEPHLKLKTVKPKIEIPEELLVNYNACFPDMKGGSGKRLRCNLKELEKVFQYFFKLYPGHDQDIILQATHLYIDEQSKEDFKYCRTAKYFCIKFKQPGMPESELIEYIERINSGETFEEQDKVRWEPRVL